MNSPRPCPPSPDLGSVSNAVWSLPASPKPVAPPSMPILDRPPLAHPPSQRPPEPLLQREPPAFQLPAQEPLHRHPLLPPPHPVEEETNELPPPPPSLSRPRLRQQCRLVPLTSIMEEIQRSILSEDDESLEDTLDIVSRDTGDSIVWLFRKVFSSSPNLAVDLLSLMAKFFIAPTEMEKRKALVVVMEGIKLDDVNGSKAGPLEIKKYRS